MSEKVRLALAGCGWIAGAHVKGYKELLENGCDTFEVTACCDPSEAAASTRAEEIGAFQGTTPAVVPSMEALLSAKLADAVDICVPHCFHHTAACEALEGGLHVMLEKPLGLTVAASRRIIETARARERILATAENVRRDLSARACAWAIRDADLIGRVRSADVIVRMNDPLNVNDPKFKWRAIKLLTGGGMIMDSGAHLTDMMLCLFGEPEVIDCRTLTVTETPVEDAPVLGRAVTDVEDEWHAVVHFKNGTRLAWTFSRVSPGEKEMRGRYYGTKGMMIDKGFPMHPFQGGGDAVLADGTEIGDEAIRERYLASLPREEKDRIFPWGVTNGFAVEVADFVRAVATGSAPELDGEAGLRAKAFSIACYESATLCEPVRFDEVMAGTVRAYQDPIDAYWQIEPASV